MSYPYQLNLSNEWTSVSLNNIGQAIACVNGGGIYYSNNSGQSWYITDISNNNWSSVSLNDYGQAYACVNGGNIYYSIDYGQTWNITSYNISNNWSCVSINNNGNAFACVNGGEIYDLSINLITSYNISNIWSSISLNDNGQVYACGEEGIYYSGDYGQNWDIISTNTNNWLCISINNYGNAIASVNGGKIYYYDLSNNIWNISNYINSIWNSVSLNDYGQAYACGEGGIYYSGDYGQTWDITIASTNENWISVSINNYGNAIACINVGGIYEIINQKLLYPTGPTGETGPTGPTGPQGIQGPTGTFAMTQSSQSVTTDPSQITAGVPFTLTYYNPYYLPIIEDTYDLRNQLGVQVSDIYIDNNNNTSFIFKNVILNAGLNLLYIHNITTGSMSPVFTKNIESINIDVSSICFKEGTKILCKVDNQEKYIPIEQLDDTVFVKTYKHGFRKVKHLLKSKIINSKEKTINKLYVMKKSETNDLIEDLYVTGSHALLKDELTEKQINKMNCLIKKINIKYDMKIDDKYKIIACFDKRFQEFNEPGYFNIYHLVLDKIYGIYANGILAESTDEITLNRMN